MMSEGTIGFIMGFAMGLAIATIVSYLLFWTQL